MKSPDIVTEYNKFMGYVDQLDMLVALDRINTRSKKWYHRIIFHFLDVILINSWCLYRAAHVSIGTQKKCIMPLLDFKLEVAQCLISQNKAHDAKKRGRPSLDSVESEFDAKRKRGPLCLLLQSELMAWNTGLCLFLKRADAKGQGAKVFQEWNVRSAKYIYALQMTKTVFFAFHTLICHFSLFFTSKIHNACFLL